MRLCCTLAALHNETPRRQAKHSKAPMNNPTMSVSILRGMQSPFFIELVPYRPLARFCIEPH
jgi:hypothetical protein